MKKKPRFICSYDCEFNVDGHHGWGFIVLPINGTGPTKTAAKKDAQVQARRVRAALVYTLTERKWTKV